MKNNTKKQKQLALTLPHLAFVLFVLVCSSAHSKAIPYEKFYSFESISPSGKAAIEKFRSDYRQYLNNELSHYDAKRRNEITHIFEKCLDHSYRDDLQTSNMLLKRLYKKYPKDPVVLWHLAINYFVMARRLPEDEMPKQIELLRHGFQKSKECIALAPNNADCWISYAASHGALALAEGIFETISEISDVKEELLKAYSMLKQVKNRCPMAPHGLDSLDVAVSALSEFNRLAPDWWLFKLISGVRGDKEASWNYAKELKVHDLASANIVARSALCHGANSDNQELINKGIALVVKGLGFELLHPFDESEYRRLARLYNAIGKLEDPDPDDYFELGCHEFGNDNKEALQKKSSKK